MAVEEKIELKFRKERMKKRIDKTNICIYTVHSNIYSIYTYIIINRSILIRSIE